MLFSLTDCHDVNTYIICIQKSVKNKQTKTNKPTYLKNKVLQQRTFSLQGLGVIVRPPIHKLGPSNVIHSLSGELPVPVEAILPAGVSHGQVVATGNYDLGYIDATRSSRQEYNPIIT